MQMDLLAIKIVLLGSTPNALVQYLVSTKNKLFRRAVRTCTPEHWATYRVARNNAIKAAKAKYVKKQASALSCFDVSKVISSLPNYRLE